MLTIKQRAELVNKNSHYGLTNYADTDSIKDKYNYTNCHEENIGSYSVIYPDFDKKREV